jgi:oligopeptide/dipeptide ABC transporter ATP-binding protein
VPRLRAPVRELAEVRGSIPSLADLPAGCTFNPRCPQAADRCRVEEPAEEAAGTERTVRCHFWK